MLRSMLRDRVFLQKLWTLAAPIAFQNLMLAAVAAADAFMLGSIAQDSMSAVSLATQIQFIQNIIFMAVTSGVGILGAQYWGKRDLRALDDLFSLGLRICAVIDLLFFAGCVFFPRALMLLLTNEETLIALGIQYLRIAGFSYLLTGFSQTYLAMMKVSDHTSAVAAISSGAVLANILLNAVLIFGLFGMPEMDVRGAAIATCIARALELAACIAVSSRSGFLRPHLRALLRRNRLLCRDYYKCMLPILGSCLLWGVCFASYSAFMGHMGTDAAAANSVAAVVRDLLCCLCNGLGNGGGILVGNELGAGKLDTGKLYGDRVTVLAFVCGGVSCALMFAFTPLILHVVRLTDNAQRLLMQMMLVMAVYMIGRAVNTIVINGIFAAGGDTMFDLYSLLVCMLGIAVPLAAIGTFWLHWPVWVVYACTCLDEVGKIPWVMIHYRKYKWVCNLTRDFSVQ